MSFKEEYRTILETHRILQTCRDGYPLEANWDRAKNLATALAGKPYTRIVQIFCDERNGVTAFNIATTSPAERAELVSMFPGTIETDANGQYTTLVEPLVAECSHKASDRYCHMTHLSLKTVINLY